MVAAEGKIMPHRPFQHHLCILQGLIIQQPVQFCPLRWGITVIVLHSDAVDGKSGAIREPGFHPVGVHIAAAGKQFRHNSILQDLIFGVQSLEPMPSSRCRMKWILVCLGVSARFLHGFLHGFKTCKGCRNSKFKTCDASPRNNVKT